MIELGSKIQSQVQSEMEKGQREYFLRQQLKAIQEELGEGDEQQAEVNELRAQLAELELPEDVRKAAERELSRLEKLPPAAAEYGVIRTYLDWILTLPWDKTPRTTSTSSSARQDPRRGPLRPREGEGPDRRVPRRLEAEGRRPGPILCFVGPPGVGKTSLGQSIARTLGRKFTRISVGGVRDEAEIRGHRRTYIGAMPGTIIRAIRDAESRNPVFLIDEIDKMGADWRGDPASAMLEVLDPEQNSTFRDHYLDLPFDLSKVLFICTANQLDTIPGPLLDRMDVIQLSGYTEDEKVQIAKRYLVPKQLEAHGLKPSSVEINDDALGTIIREYTREAGAPEPRAPDRGRPAARPPAGSPRARSERPDRRGGRPRGARSAPVLRRGAQAHVRRAIRDRAPPSLALLFGSGFTQVASLSLVGDRRTCACAPRRRTGADRAPRVRPPVRRSGSLSTLALGEPRGRSCGRRLRSGARGCARPASRVYSRMIDSQRVVVDRDVLARRGHAPRAASGPGSLLRDLDLLLLGVAGELDHVHAVAQRRRDRVELVRGADEQHLREVERHIEIVVAEGRVLLGVEHLEHRARRIAAQVGAHLVDLVDQEHRVRSLGVADRPDDRAGHRADVGAAVPADLGLVADAADGDAHELAAERRARSTGRARSCRRRAARRSRGSGPRGRPSASRRRGTRGSAP